MNAPYFGPQISEGDFERSGDSGVRSKRSAREVIERWKSNLKERRGRGSA
jgi:hypothetical protein